MDTNATTLAINDININILNIKSDMDFNFVLLCAVFVFAMQIGFAFLEAGLERTKNATNMLMKTVVNGLVAATVFWACGYAFGFGVRGNGNGFIGTKYFFLSEADPNQPQETAWFFQWTFVSATSAIVSGALAGRTGFQTYLLFSIIMCGWIYPVIAHWMWAPTGWLHPGSVNCPFHIGVVDFAGGSVVHVVGGTAGLIGAIITGPRLNRFTHLWDGPRKGVISVSKSMWTTLGVFLLWMGWYGFNMGSSGKASNGFSKLSGIIAVNNTLAASAGGIIPLIIHKFWKKNWDITVTLNGVLAALASNTPACAFVYPWAAWIIGGLGGVIAYFISHLLQHLKIDDPLDASAIHLGGGAWGLIATGLFAIEQRIIFVHGVSGYYGLFMGGGGLLLGIELLGAVVTLCWTALWASLYFLLAKMLGIARVSSEVEKLGLDVAHIQMTQMQKELYKTGKGMTDVEITQNPETNTYNTVN